jgi:hypothetical protein
LYLLHFENEDAEKTKGVYLYGTNFGLIIMTASKIIVITLSNSKFSTREHENMVVQCGKCNYFEV